MPTPAAQTAPPEKVALYEKLIATNPKVERKGATVPYTSVNGNMSSYLNKDGKLQLRLGLKDREAFVVKYQAKLTQAYGVLQPEYVGVPGDLLEKTNEFKKWFDASFAYVSSLNQSPPRKPRKLRP